MKRRIDYAKHITVLIISPFVFAGGLAFGSMLTETKMSLLDEQITKIEISLTSPELEFLFKDVMGRELSCEYFNAQLYDIVDNTNKLATEIIKYEETNDPFFSEKE